MEGQGEDSVTAGLSNRGGHRLHTNSSSPRWQRVVRQPGKGPVQALEAGQLARVVRSQVPDKEEEEAGELGRF